MYSSPIWCGQSKSCSKSPGNINHARWLIRANRILRLYVSNKNPEENLVHLVSNILNLYAPCWFHIKSHHVVHKVYPVA